MDNDLRALKGRQIVDVYETDQAYYLMLKDGTRIELGYETEVITPTCRDCKKRLPVTKDSPTCLLCEQCASERLEARRMQAEKEREFAMADTPILAALRRELET